MNIIDEAFPGGGHVVILGAGASIASSIMDSEKFGRVLPSMQKLPEVIFMGDIIQKIPQELYSDNFETLYSNLYASDPNNPLLSKINRRIYEYFSDLYLPDKPTISDLLVMSLRPKDLIATFNWDPFLYQAWWRNYFHGASPAIAFLHGNVAVRYNSVKNAFRIANLQRADDNEYSPVPLLYPTGQKDYEGHPFIKNSWEMLRNALNSDCTKRVTIFGYSAPVSDSAAIGLMKDAWGTPDRRNVEQFEIIDIRSEAEVRHSWDSFIHSYHYDCCTSFFDSSISQYPRRTSESFFFKYFPTTPEEAFVEPNPLPRTGFQTFEEMWAWFDPLIRMEEKKAANQ